MIEEFDLMIESRMMFVLRRRERSKGRRALWHGALIGLILGASGCGPSSEHGEAEEEPVSAEAVLAASQSAGATDEDLPAWTGEEPAGEVGLADGSGTDWSELDDFEAAKRDFDAASSLVAEGRFEEALTLLERAAKIDPDNEEVQYHLAFSLSRLNRPEEAIQHYQRTLEIFPDYAEARINLGNLFMNQGSFQEAEKAFRLALEVAPELASVHNNLGTLLGRQGRVVEAIPLFVVAVRLDPQYIQALCNLGNAYLSQGRNQEAATQFSLALAIRPDFPPAIGGMQRARLRIDSDKTP
jgi:tetratricopeptide (TPR) repeat protein